MQLHRHIVIHSHTHPYVHSSMRIFCLLSSISLFFYWYVYVVCLLSFSRASSPLVVYSLSCACYLCLCLCWMWLGFSQMVRFFMIILVSILCLLSFRNVVVLVVLRHRSPICRVPSSSVGNQEIEEYISDRSYSIQQSIWTS